MPNREFCQCGAPDCETCGPAQGYHRCEAHGEWDCPECENTDARSEALAALDVAGGWAYYEDAAVHLSQKMGVSYEAACDILADLHEKEKPVAEAESAVEQIEEDIRLGLLEPNEGVELP